MVLCSIGIFLTIPIGRKIQRFVYDNWGRELFLYFVLACLAIGGIVLLYLLVFKLKIRSPSNYIWLIICGVLYTYFTLSLRNIPEETVHFLEYGLLSFLIFRALLHRVRDKSIYLTTSLLALLIGTFDEILQWITPERYWDFRDAGLNGLSAGLLQIVLWKVIKPKEISGKINPSSIRIISSALASCILVFGLCASNTPRRVAHYTKILPWLSFLQKEEPMSEFGYKYKDREIGTFFSRLSLKVLRQNDEKNAPRYAKVINESLNIPYEQFLRDYNPINNPFLYEIRIHVFRRDTYFEKAKVANNPNDKIESYFIAYKENLILEKYFGHTIEKSIYSWAKEKIDKIDLLTEKKDKSYESPVSAGLFTAFSEKTMWIYILITLMILGLINYYIRCKEDRKATFIGLCTK